MTTTTHRIAAAHYAPVFNDSAATIDKACEIIGRAAGQGIELLAFPEVFIPGFPHWCRVIPPNNSDRYYAALVNQAISIGDPKIRQLCQAARKHRIVVSIGFTEIAELNRGSIWNSNLLIGANGAILNHHRKLVPTFAEKTIYAPGDGAGLRVCDTSVGRVGALICGENTNPLARYALMAQGEQIHISSYPSVVPARSLEEGGYDLTEAIRIRAAAHAFEAKVFNIVASTPFDATARTALEPLGNQIMALVDAGARAVSLIVDPNGKVISDVLKEEEGFAIADVDTSASVAHKRMHDVVGHYNRFDIFRLTVDMRRPEPIYTEHEPDAQAEAIPAASGEDQEY